LCPEQALLTLSRKVLFFSEGNYTGPTAARTPYTSAIHCAPGQKVFQSIAGHFPPLQKFMLLYNPMRLRQVFFPQEFESYA
jgi:hypothetical protein